MDAHPIETLPADLHASLQQRLARWRELLAADAAARALEAAITHRATLLFLASDFAFDFALNQPAALFELLADPTLVPDWPAFEADTPQDFAARLRQFRQRGSVALILRDVLGIDTVEATLAGASRLARVCIEAALREAERQLATRYGEAQDGAGRAQRVVVVGMGKLGGGELNFSSDVDLILAFAEAGQSSGPQRLDNEEYFTRLGQRLAQLLGEVSAEGFVLRVDYRLRPYGGAGRLALSFNAMEQYYQREGRDWERYAWIKAQAVAGDLLAGAALIETLRPFVYRRYLDYTAIEGLRELKIRIDQEVARQDLADNLKLGPGGIRELEFAVQLAQLIRGGREPALRVSGFLPALAALQQIGQFDNDSAGRIRDHYRFLRRLENRVQMFADKQTHSLPEAPEARLRIALALGYADVDAMRQAVTQVRAEVAELFAATLDVPGRGRRVVLDSAPQSETGQVAPDMSAAVQEAIHALLASLPVRRMESRARARLERALPLVLLAARKTAAVDDAALRLLALLHAIAGRPSYLALLAERRAARERLAQVFARSAFLAERVSEHPLLLDDLLDPRIEDGEFDAQGFAEQIEQRLVRVVGVDAEAELAALHEVRQSALFRVALGWLNRNHSAAATAERLAVMAEGCVRSVLALARRDLANQYGPIPDGLLVIGYGSFGGRELGLASDLDLVFLFDPALNAWTGGGPRALDGPRLMARWSQRVLHWLGTPTHTGALYEIDVRLRPDGRKGLLVSALDAFQEYQHRRAWIWEQQALVRARVVAGPAPLTERFNAIRQELLCRVRDPAEVRREVAAMRERWRHELDRSSAQQFDLKQGRGGLVDIEFLLQAMVLIHAERHPELTTATSTPALIAALLAAGLFDAEAAERLHSAHADWLAAALDRGLAAGPRLIDRSAEVDARAAEVQAIVAAMLAP
ncbi:MAG: bifunctional [glutamate--ammonia ligase]-adenylyl-L-tyrosine phosphorylase/[glutamate--ammonia-ligase] adenylyltransferase [Lysobacterales bacterium]